MAVAELARLVPPWNQVSKLYKSFDVDDDKYVTGQDGVAGGLFAVAQFFLFFFWV